MSSKKKDYRKINTSPQSKGKRKVQNDVTNSEFGSKKSRQIGGVCLIFAGIILFVLAVLPSVQGAISHFLNSWVHVCLGLFSYILPFALIAIGVSLFVDKSENFNRTGFIAGLSIFVVGFMSLVSCMAPISVLGTDDPSLLFSNSNLVSYGGYVGNSLAWLLITLFGKVISVIICIFIMTIGFIVGGFSYSSFKSRILKVFGRENVSEHEESRPINKNIQFDKNGDIDPSSFEGFDEQKQTTILTKWHDKLKKNKQENKYVQPELPLDKASATTEVVEKAKESLLPTRKIASTAKAKATQTDKKQEEETEQSLAESDFVLPSFDLLEKPKATSKSKNSEKVLAQTAQNLQQTLEEFGVMASVVGWVAGPTVTLFKIELPAGVRVNKVQNLGTDLALALATASVRIFAPIPGTNYVGIEVPNKIRETVVLSEVLKDAKAGPLQIAIGKDVEGKSVVCNLATMPHLLIGGTTGSGKSVSVNAMIMSILMRGTPDDVRLILIDPKRVEFTPYNGIPHLYVPVVTEPKEAASALSWGVAEMERRLKLMSEISARNITEYNTKVKSGAFDDIKKMTSDGESETKKHTHLPYIVIIIDELADLMMNVGKEVEMSICRLAQLARAAGIHLIVATQRPSTNVVTGLIKSNITNRIAFNVASSIDSRVILDSTGAEDLIGLGDLLLSKPELGKPVRIQGCFVSEKEITSVVDFIKEQGEPEYNNEIISTNIMGIGDANPSPTGGQDDELVWEAADIVISTGLGSTSNLQRRLKVGYSRAGRIMDQLEEKGIVGPANGSKPREVLIDALELETLKAFEAND